MDATKVCRLLVSIFLISFNGSLYRRSGSAAGIQIENEQLADRWDSATLRRDKSKTRSFCIACKPFCDTFSGSISTLCSGEGEGSFDELGAGSGGDLPAPTAAGTGQPSRFATHLGWGAGGYKPKDVFSKITRGSALEAKLSAGERSSSALVSVRTSPRDAPNETIAPSRCGGLCVPPTPRNQLASKPANELSESNAAVCSLVHQRRRERERKGEEKGVHIFCFTSCLSRFSHKVFTF